MLSLARDVRNRLYTKPAVVSMDYIKKVGQRQRQRTMYTSAKILIVLRPNRSLHTGRVISLASVAQHIHYGDSPPLSALGPLRGQSPSVHGDSPQLPDSCPAGGPSLPACRNVVATRAATPPERTTARPARPASDSHGMILPHAMYGRGPFTPFVQGPARSRPRAALRPAQAASQSTIAASRASDRNDGDGNRRARRASARRAKSAWRDAHAPREGSGTPGGLR